VNGVVNQGEPTGSLLFANIEATPATPTIEDLEARVADNPDDPATHQALGEALIEAGERERGIEELDHATAGFENLGNLSHAQDLVNEILRLDPNSVRHRQKQVEFAFKSGDKVRLIDAYLELADTLLRQDLPAKARAVYQRVAEHDATNERAKAALSMLAPVAAPSFEEKPKAPRLQQIGRSIPEGSTFAEHSDDQPFMASMGVYVFTRRVLLELLDQEPGHDFGRSLIPNALGKYRVKSHLYRGYWADVGTIESFYEANVMLGRPAAPFRFWDPKYPIYTHLRQLPGSRLTDCVVRNSVVRLSTSSSRCSW